MTARVALSLFLVFTSCAPLAPDPAVLEGLAGLEQKIDGFLVSLEEGSHEKQSDHDAVFFAELHADLAKLRPYVAPGDSRTRVVLDQLYANIDRLEAAHRKGIDAEEVPLLRLIFATNFAPVNKLQDYDSARAAGKER